MATQPNPDASLSLYRLLDPEVLANPWPFYARLREADPVHWDPFLHCWVVTRYPDVLHVLHHFSAARTPGAEQMRMLGLAAIEPIAAVMERQMLFLDAPAHTYLRKLCSTGFTPRRVEKLEARIAATAGMLIDRVIASGRMDVIADFAAPFPSIVTAHLLGVPEEDHAMLKRWSADFAEMLGNLGHNPDRVGRVRATLDAMVAYFRAAIREDSRALPEGLIASLVEAEVDGLRLSEDEVIANVIVTMVGGQETGTNLIGNGLLTLLRQPAKLAELRGILDGPRAAVDSAIEELLRYETPSQHTARICPEDTIIGGRMIRKGQPVMAVMAAANRDPERFADPDELDFARADNRHLAFGWAAHFCFGASLARMEARIAFDALLRRLGNLRRDADRLEWRENLGLRGLKALPVRFD